MKKRPGNLYATVNLEEIFSILYIDHTDSDKFCVILARTLKLTDQALESLGLPQE